MTIDLKIKKREITRELDNLTSNLEKGNGNGTPKPKEEVTDRFLNHYFKLRGERLLGTYPVNISRSNGNGTSKTLRQSCEDLLKNIGIYPLIGRV